MLHTLPFLLSNLHTALLLAYGGGVLELLAISWIRWRWMGSRIGPTIVEVVIGGGIVFASGIWLGRFGAT